MRNWLQLIADAIRAFVILTTTVVFLALVVYMLAFAAFHIIQWIFML